MDLERFKSKKIALLGFGIENVSVAKFLIFHKIEFTILDRASVEKLSDQAKKLIEDEKLEFKGGENYLSDLDQFNIIVRSPGVPYLTPEIQAAKKIGVEITSSTKLFFDLSSATIIGVTGTKGKGTTASIIKEIIAQSFKKNTNSAKVYLVGNIGVPSFDIIAEVESNDIVVFELSSFQLQDMEVSPHIAVIVNLADDHLDHHQTVEEYRETKQNILKYQNKNDFAIINWDYPESRKLSKFGDAKKFFFSSKEKVNGAYVAQSGEVFLTRSNEKVCNQSDLKIIGRHNLENVAAAAIVGDILEIPIQDIYLAVKEFDGLPHRLEFIRQIDGVKFYNDSFSTNPTPTIAAIKSFDVPITIILGGSEKGADFSLLAKVVKSSTVKNVISIGVEGPKIRQALIENRANVNILNGGKNIESIVELAMKNTVSGGVVLFSPACASFDMFKNYKDRGEKFIAAVKNL